MEGLKVGISGPDACEVKPHSKPWIVNITPQMMSKFRCGGTLIGKRFVLTAAHCVCKGAPPCDWWKKVHMNEVTVGDHDRRKDDNGEKRIGIKDVIPHEKYNGN